MPTIDDAGADAYEYAENEDETINRQQDALQQIHPQHLKSTYQQQQQQQQQI